MDTFIDSSWYFLRYPDAQNANQVFDPAKVNDWMPVDQYVGGGLNTRFCTCFIRAFSPNFCAKDLRRAIHTAIQETTHDLAGDYQFNTAVSELMKLSNALNEATCVDSPVYAEGIETLLRLLAPFAPHISEELWHQLGHQDSVHQQPWPVADPQALVVDEITIVIQVMGKTRGTIQVPAGADKQALEDYARQSTAAQRHIEGKEIKKVIVVPGKLVNFVVAG